MPSIVELFGYESNDNSPVAQAARSGRLCPYLSSTCVKGFNDGTPSGVCSLKRDAEVLPVCPRRLYADNYRPLLDIAGRCFPATLPLVRAAA
jgi:hypothetical protein